MSDQSKRIIQNNPKLKAGLQRAQQHLKPFLAVLKCLEPQFRAADDEWRRTYGEPPPTSIDDLQRSLVRAGMSPDKAIAGDYTAAEAFLMIEGYLKRLRDGTTGSDDSDSYVPASWLLGTHPEIATAAKQSKFLNSHPEIRQRKPYANRREVHAADWFRFWQHYDELQYRALDTLGNQITDIERRKHAVKNLQNRRK